MKRGLHPGARKKPKAKFWGSEVADTLLDGVPAGEIKVDAIARKAGGKALPTASVFLNGKNYARSYRFGNKSSEAIVRRNLERFIIDAQAAVKLLLKEGRLGSEFFGQKNTLLDVDLLMSDFQLLPENYLDGKGKPMKIGKSLRYAIRQFFLDADFAYKVCRQAVREYNEELKSKGRQDDIVA